MHFRHLMLPWQCGEIFDIILLFISMKCIFSTVTVCVLTSHYDCLPSHISEKSMQCEGQERTYSLSYPRPSFSSFPSVQLVTSLCSRSYRFVTKPHSSLSQLVVLTSSDHLTWDHFSSSSFCDQRFHIFYTHLLLSETLTFLCSVFFRISFRPVIPKNGLIWDDYTLKSNEKMMTTYWARKSQATTSGALRWQIPWKNCQVRACTDFWISPSCSRFLWRLKSAQKLLLKKERRRSSVR